MFVVNVYSGKDVPTLVETGYVSSEPRTLALNEADFPESPTLCTDYMLQCICLISEFCGANMPL